MREEIINNNLILYTGLGIVVVLLIFALIKVNTTIKIVKEIVNDTLKKRDDKGVLHYSRTSLTMFSAWVIAIYMVLHDLYKTGFRFEVFCMLVGVALGSKVTDAFSKKIDPTIVGPTNSNP